MAFFLASKSNLRESFALVAASEVDALLRPSSEVYVATSPREVDERVHETRKSIKRLRALLRLYRKGLSSAAYAEEDARLRALGKSLARARDAVAVRESLERLVASAPLKARSRLSNAMPALTAALEAGAASGEPAILPVLESVHDALAAFAVRAAGFRVHHAGFSLLAPGFRRTYERGRRALRRALARTSERRLHRLRAAVKRHQYQLHLLEPLWPETIGALRREAQRVGELLGRDHDLFLLERHFERWSERPDLLALKPAFRDAAEACHREAHREALAVAARLYAESPTRIVARFRAYFEAWT